MAENELPRINNGDGEANNPPVYRSMMDCGIPTIEDVRPSIVRPTVTANQYEIKPAIIQMIQNTVQFGGSTIDDPNAHIENFLEICDTFKQQGVSDDAIRLRLFPFSLRDKAKSWLNSLPAGSIITWGYLAKAFLTKYFPPSKSMKLRTDITMFAQGEQESLYEAWERYKDMLRRCPHHQLPDWLVVQTFYYGLLSANRTMLDAAAGGNLLRKSPEDGYELFEEMASSSYQPQSERSMMQKSAGIHQVDAFTSMTAQLEAMNKNIDGLSLGNSATRIQEVFCDRCQGEHFTKDCQDGNPFYVQDEAPVNHVGSQNHPRFDPYSNTYNLGWRKHPNFSWGGHNNQSRPYQNQNPVKQPQEEKSSLEQMMQNFISSTETRMQNQDATIRSLENQIGQLANRMSNREPGTLPSDTETNPKEQVKAVELRSGKKLETKELEHEERKKEGEKEPSTGKSSDSTQSPTSKSNIVIPPPFPAALKKAKLDSQFSKFLEVFKKLHINIPFADALLQMPSYAKFLKEILASKRKIEEHVMVNLTENCSALVQNKIPPKLKDPESFSIPCMIGDVVFIRLCVIWVPALT
ncbi:uncharacterized protein [Henckelia pumila]|uniref:uncharacterized protein n=1 Tax=Henckelia pumila TaxID=405737 RepID=UPI003C6E66F8